MSKLTTEQYREIEAKLIEIKAQFDPLFDLAWSNESFRLGRDLADLQQSIQGLIYMSHPQEEWTGGDSSNPKNFKVRMPHIEKLN